MMGKLVILTLDGDLAQGLRAQLAISTEGNRPETEINGQLPPAPDLITDYNDWQAIYRSLGMSVRKIKLKSVVIDGSITTQTQQLQTGFNRWLSSPSLQALREKWLEKVSTTEQVRILIRTSNPQLRQLPWQQWDFVQRYEQAEVALGAAQYQQPAQSASQRHSRKVRILAILGHSEGINIQQDRNMLENLPHADITFLVEPHRQQLNDKLWEQPWDILFFAGHSDKENERGRIYLNPSDSLTIDELKEALKKAINNGLKLAIFNSCDGLNLAQELEQLHIPQTIIMREPVPDQIAQLFLQYFLQEFAAGASLYQAVGAARKKLQGWEDQYPCASWLPIICQNPAAVPPTWQQLRGIEHRPVYIPLVTSLAVTLLIILVRQLGLLQTWELKAYDHLLRQRPNEEIDPRLLVVEATATDIERYGFPLPDAIVAQIIAKLNSYSPRIVGLDIHRNRPREPGNQALLEQLQNNQQLIAICKTQETRQTPGIKPPPGLPESRLGFSDLIPDTAIDGVLRRHLLSMQPYPSDPCGTDHAFSIRLAFAYLAAQGIKPHATPEGHEQLDSTIMRRLSANAGAYHNLDNAGFQILLNYRPQVARQVSVSELLAGKVKPEFIQDKIVLIGVSAPIAKDYFATPYTYQSADMYQEMSGVVIHAQMVSQIISAVLNGRPLLWVWSDLAEVLWIGAWGIVGGLITWRCSRFATAIVLIVAANGVLYLFCFGLLLMGGWIPLIPAALDLLFSSGGVLIYRLSYQMS